MDLQQKVKDNEDYDKLVKSLQELQEIQDDIARLLWNQDQKIDSVEENMFHSTQNINASVQELEEAKNLKFRYYPLVLGGLLGGVVGGPLGMLAGIKYTGLTASAGSLIGGMGGYLFQ